MADFPSDGRIILERRSDDTVAAAGGGVNSVDMSRGFEIAFGSRADSASWSETDALSKLNGQDSALAHAGTYSLSVTIDADAVTAYQAYDMGADKTALSHTMWFYAPTNTVSASVISFALRDASNPIVRIYYDSVFPAGTYRFRLRGTGFSSDISIGTNTGQWYRIELDYVANPGTSTLSVYDSSGTLIGSGTATASAFNARYIRYGCTEGSGTDRWSVFYIDDIGLDYTDSTTPLWPYTVAD